jgi:hypothetical protein
VVEDQKTHPTIQSQPVLLFDPYFRTNLTTTVTNLKHVSNQSITQMQHKQRRYFSTSARNFQNKSQNAQHPKLLGISITRGLYLIEINLNLNWWLKS